MSITLTPLQLVLALAAILWLSGQLTGPHAAPPPPVIVVQSAPPSASGTGLGWLLLALAGAWLTRSLWMG